MNESRATEVAVEAGAAGVAGAAGATGEARAAGGSMRERVSRLALPRVRAYQRAVDESAARFKHVMCGRRWGKTKVALVAACGGHGPVRGQLPGALQGGRIGWVVPAEEHPAAAEAWADLKRALAPAATAASEERKRIEVQGGGSVQLWSGYDPDALRGPYFDGVVVDECSVQHDKLWGALRPTLSDYGGWALLLGTVPEDAVNHWFARLHRYACSEAGQARGWQAWRLPSRQNPQLHADDLAEARETLGLRTFLREYEAELVTAEGGVWQEEWFRFYEEVPAADELQQVEVVLDAAWKTGVRNDYSSCQVWGKSATDYYLLGEVHGKWESPELRRRVAAFRAVWAAQYPGQAVPLVVESAGGGLVALQELRASVDFPVVEFAVKGSSKMARSEAVSPLAESGKVWLPSPRIAPWVSEWVAELVGFPHLAHDDRCDAAVMALQRLKGWLAPAHVLLPPRERDYGDGGEGRYGRGGRDGYGSWGRYG